MDLIVRQTPIGAFCVLHVSGEVDLATLPKFSDALVRATSGALGATIVVDLDGVHVFDDAGLGLLLGAAGRTRQTGGDLVVLCSTPGLRQHLELTGFDRGVRVVAGMSELR